VIIEKYLFCQDAEWRAPKADIRYKRIGEWDKGKPFRKGFHLNHGGQKEEEEEEEEEEEVEVVVVVVVVEEEEEIKLPLMLQ
jgi:hypothetical protein